MLYNYCEQMVNVYIAYTTSIPNSPGTSWSWNTSPANLIDSAAMVTASGGPFNQRTVPRSNKHASELSRTSYRRWNCMCVSLVDCMELLSIFCG